VVVRGSGGALCEGCHGVTDEDDSVCKEELFDVHIGAGHELDPGDVAASEVGGLIEAVGNDEDLTLGSSSTQGGDEGFGLSVSNGEGLDRAELAAGDEVTQNPAESQFADVLRNVLGIITWAWAENHTTTDKDRGALVAVTGVTCALLLVDFLVVSGNLTAGLGVGGTGTAVGAVGGHEIVNGLTALFFAYQNEVGGLGVFCSEGLNRHDLGS